MTASNACPEESLLQELISDRLAPREAERLVEHIDRCENCQARLARAAAAPHLASRLPKLKQEFADSSHLDDVIRRAKSLRETVGVTSCQATATDPNDTLVDVTAFTKDGYELLGVIGRGGMGVVYRAREKSLDRIVAVKVLAPILATDVSARKRFLQEARSAASVVHPNVITIHAVSDEPPIPYLVMEYVEGITLQRQLDSASGISIRNVARIGRQIAAGLSAAHAMGVVHRDVKPANILINARTGKVLLGDFGLARATDQARLTRTGTLVGTPAYVAPEVLENPDAADHRADLFSFGVVLYAMCSGDSPFQADSLLGTLRRLSSGPPEPLSRKVDQVPSWLSDIVMRLLDRDPARRFQSAEEVREALASGLERVDSKAEVNRITTAPTAVTENANSLVTINAASKTQTRIAKRKVHRHLPILWILAGILSPVALFAALAFGISGGNKTESPSSRQTENNQTRRFAANSRKPLNPPRRAAGGGLASGRLENGTSQPGGVGLPPSDRNRPFVVVTESGDAVATFASLQEAIERRPLGSRIEIHATGELKSEPCFVEDGAVNISAGTNFQPVLVFTPDEDSELGGILSVTSSLTMQGVGLLLPADTGAEVAALVNVEEGGAVKLIDCSLVVAGGGCCLTSEGDVSLIDCLLHAPQSTAFDLVGGDDTRVDLRNCCVSGEIGAEVYSDENLWMGIVECTFACGQCFRFVGEEFAGPGNIHLKSQTSLFVSRDALLMIEHEDEIRLKQVVDWVGWNNVYSGAVFCIDDEEDWSTKRASREFEQWKGMFAETQSTYVAFPFEMDADELSDLLGDEDFRLSEIEKIKSVSAGARD